MLAIQQHVEEALFAYRKSIFLEILVQKRKLEEASFFQEMKTNSTAFISFAIIIQL